MKISNVKVYGLHESIHAAGYPVRADLEKFITDFDMDLGRAASLGNVPSGSGHDNFLKGIVVQFDIKAPEYFFRQFDRYHFHDYVSSQSKMHCIANFDLDEMTNAYVDENILGILKVYIEIYRKNRVAENLEKVISNCPMGLELTARITSNYLQEKNIHHQRRNHKLKEWQEYCNWLETLPYFPALCLKEKGE